MGTIITLLSRLLLCVGVGVARGAAPEVQTPVGTIVGRYSEAKFDNATKPVTQFLGVPYAEEPTGPLRFSKPVPRANFSSPYNASSTGPACPQNMYANPDKNLTILEDCLNLNIFVPGDMGRGGVRAANFPVLVWIYGGGFAWGAAQYYDGSIISAFNDVIVVTINYRLSVFGFLSTGDATSPGNYGLWDQHLAIKWVHDNIGAFGGDASKITVAGESAGSASVYYQATYPGNKGLFQRIIGESGVTMSPWAFTGDKELLQHNLEYYAQTIKCPLTDRSTFMTCMRGKTIQELMAALKVTERVIELGARFNPVLDGEFVAKPPQALFDGPDSAPEFEMFKSVDILTGVNSMDGSVYTLTLWNDVIESVAHQTIDKGCPRQVFETVIIPHVTKALYNTVSERVNDAVIFQYTDWFDPDNENLTRSNLMNMSSDFTFYVPTIKSINKHLELNKGSPNAKGTYFYEFSQRPSFERHADWVSGACHADELAFVFGFASSLARAAGLPPAGLQPTAEEVTLAIYVMVYWTNFVKSGDPNFPVKLTTIKWPPYDVTQQTYMDFTVHMSPASVKSKLIAQRDAFWEIYVPKLLRQSPRSYHISNETHL